MKKPNIMLGVMDDLRGFIGAPYTPVTTKQIEEAVLDLMADRGIKLDAKDIYVCRSGVAIKIFLPIVPPVTDQSPVSLDAAPPAP